MMPQYYHPSAHYHRERFPTCAAIRAIRRRVNIDHEHIGKIAQALGCKRQVISEIAKGYTYRRCGGAIGKASRGREGSLSIYAVADMRRRYAAKELRVAELARLHHTSYRTALRAITGDTYAWIADPPPVRYGRWY